MGHDHGPDQPCCYPPRGSPRVDKFLVFVLEPDIERLRKVLAEVVRRSYLQRAPVTHQCFESVGAKGACELLTLTFKPGDHGHSKIFFDQRAVYLENPQGFLFGIFLGSVHGVSLLPEEFGCAEKKTCHLLPPHNVGPLVDQDRKIAPRANPLAIKTVDYRFRSGTDGQPFFEFVVTPMRYPCYFRRKTFDVFGFTLQMSLRNE